MWPARITLLYYIYDIWKFSCSLRSLVKVVVKLCQLVSLMWKVQNLSKFVYFLPISFFLHYSIFFKYYLQSANLFIFHWHISDWIFIFSSFGNLISIYHEINSADNVLKIVRNLYSYVLVFTLLELKRSLASRQESFMPLRFKWRIAGLTHKRLEVTATLPQGIVIERWREPKRNGKPLRRCVIVLIVQTWKFPSQNNTRPLWFHIYMHIYMHTYI